MVGDACKRVLGMQLLQKDGRCVLKEGSDGQVGKLEIFRVLGQAY